jgi:hypothetical protein
MDGVVLRPSLFAITTGSLPSNTATQLFVVPKSIPIILLMMLIFFASYLSKEMPIGFLCRFVSFSGDVESH